MIRFIDIDDVYRLHGLIIQRAGTKATVRDFSLLHSAVERPKVTYLGRSLYPTIFAKAAALLHSICLNHPFTDGNKRTAWATTVRFLWVNNCHLQAERKEAVKFMLRVDSEKLELAEIAKWLKVHSKKNG